MLRVVSVSKIERGICALVDCYLILPSCTSEYVLSARFGSYLSLTKPDTSPRDRGLTGAVQVRIPMRYSNVMALALFLVLLFLWGRHLRTPIHVSDTAYDLLLSTLLSHNVPEVSVGRLQEFQHLLDARTYREFEVSHIPGAIWVGYEEFSLDRYAWLLRNDRMMDVSKFFR